MPNTNLIAHMPNHSLDNPIIVPAAKTRRQEFLDLVLSKTTNPIHRRIIEAYRSGASVQAAEEELAKLLSEVINEN
jgi:hypothetical protein